jgi:TolB-like protein
MNISIKYTIIFLALTSFLFGEPKLVIKKNNNTAGKINQIIKFVADQLSHNKNFPNLTKSTIAISSFVNMENLKETNKIGNLISENLIHDMQIRGYRVIDYKTMPGIKLGNGGDFIFSRNAKDLNAKANINYILTGTYTYYRDGISLNARIIDLSTNIVVSTAQGFITKSSLMYITDEYEPYTKSITKDKYVVPRVKKNIITLRQAKD